MSSLSVATNEPRLETKLNYIDAETPLSEYNNHPFANCDTFCPRAFRSANYGQLTYKLHNLFQNVHML